jgi:hypothetical protein
LPGEYSPLDRSDDPAECCIPQLLDLSCGRSSDVLIKIGHAESQ